MDRQRTFQILGYVAGTLAAFVIGLLAPLVARGAATYLADEPTVRAVYALLAMLVAGALAGIFGRGILGLVALGLGLVLADVAAKPLEFPRPDWLPALVVALGLATLGYVIARAVDPLWGPATPDQSGSRIAG